MVTTPDSKIGTIFNRLASLPTLPEVAEKCLQLSEQEASPKEFAKVIETDPGITAKVLKLVNSAFYSLKSPVASLQHACNLLGVRTIKSLVLSVSVMQAFKRRCHGFDTKLFWRNSLATAIVARKIAKHFRVGDDDRVEEIYIAGLLHASGVPLYVQFFPDDYADVLKKWQDLDESLLDLEEAEFGAGHPEAGGEIATHWRFPESVCAAINYHRVETEEIPDDLDEGVRQMIGVVRLADHWTRKSGIPFHTSDTMPAEQPLQIPEWMAVDEAALEEVIGDPGEILAGLESIFQ